MTDVKQPSEKTAVEGADSEPVKMFTHITQSTLDNETNLSSGIWAYILSFALHHLSGFSSASLQKMLREEEDLPSGDGKHLTLPTKWSPSIHLAV